jgi:hypothetical protein
MAAAAAETVADATAVATAVAATVKAHRPSSKICRQYQYL